VGRSELIDWQLLRDCAGFVRRAVRRHKKLAVAVLALCAALTLLGLKFWPRTWQVEASILAQRTAVMPALGNPQRAVPPDADAPTRAASEIVMRHENLLALIKQTDLLDRWDLARSPLHKAKDAMLRTLGQGLNDEDKLDALIGFLEKRMTVEVADGTVRIGLEWPDAEMAYRLVEAAQQSFMEARHVAEVSTIAEAISILDGHALSVRRQMDEQLAEVLKHQAKRGRARLRGPALAAQPEAPTAAEPDEETSRLWVLFNARRRALEDLEEFRQRRLSELEGRLNEARGTFAEPHPAVQSVEKSMAQLRTESPPAAALRRETERLAAELKKRGVVEPLAGLAQGAADRPVPAAALLAARPLPDEHELDPTLEVLRDRLGSTLRKLEGLQDRVEAARIELDTARAAFKYRYSVVKPAQLPKKPLKPTPIAIVLGGLFAGLALAVLIPVAADLRGGRIVEAWQAERGLNLPLLGEVRQP
jgi:uncharacterized protein involved in exopolysaccharide biosynthesis